MAFAGEESIAKAGRCVIVWLNTMFVVLGVITVAIGVILKTASDVGFISASENAIKIALNAVLKGTYLTNYSIENFSISELFSGISTAMIVLGIFILLFSFFGCCGGCFQMKIMLIIYAVLVGSFLVAEIIFVIVMYADPSTIQSWLRDIVKNTLEDYHGIKGSNVASMGWMFVMYEFKCCGVDDYRDFHHHSPMWDRDPMKGGINISAPITCCKVIPEQKDTPCAILPELDIHERGCFDAVWAQLLGKPLYAGIGFTLIFTFQAVLVVFSAVMSRNIDESQKVEPIYG